jgi:hypothetical protein
MKKSKNFTKHKKKIHAKRKYTKHRHYKKVKSNTPLVSVNVVPPDITPNLYLKKPRKKRGTNVTKMYFTQDTEDAVVAYNKEENQDIREQIFQDKIFYPFQKLVENIFNTFKFSYFETGPQDVQKECLTHLVANMHKFDPNRKSKANPNNKAKAYSYFSIIAKHYLIFLNNNNYKKFNQNVEISEEHDKNTVQLQQYDKYYAQQELSDFMKLAIEFWEKNLVKIFTKQRDLKIADAVIELMKKSQHLTLFNKKALYLYIRDISQCKTQQITKVITRMKQYQKVITRSYLNNGDINCI